MSNKRYRSFMYTQQLIHLSGNMQPYGTILESYLNDHLPKGTDWAYIVHDKDYYTLEDEKKDPKRLAGSPKESHVHIAMYLPNAKTISALASDLNVKPNYITKFSGRNGKQNLFSYLVHKTEGSKLDGKYEYGYEEVVTNFEYKHYVEGVASSLTTASMEKATIQQMIMNGELRFIDFVMNPKYQGFYLNNKTFVTNCIDMRYKQLMNLRGEDEDGDEKSPIEIIYIEGAEGSGKTYYARAYANNYYRDYCVSSSQNDVTQDYLGQDVMIFDDARPNDFTASEWLKILDPYNNQSTVSSRYYNKFLAVKCIILTTTTPFEEFFVYAKGKGSVDEPVGQFMRRFTYVIKCKRLEELGLLYTTGNIYEVEACKTPTFRFVGDTRVNYRFEIQPTGETFKTMIANMNANQKKKPSGRFSAVREL